MKRFALLFISSILFAGISPVLCQDVGGIYEKGILEKKAVPYPHLREADVMWSKQLVRLIDLRQKINHSLYYPTVQMPHRKNLMGVILEAIRSGEVTSIYNFNIGDDEMTIPMLPVEVEDKLGAKVDSFKAIDPVTGQEELSVVEQPADLSEVKQYFVKEEWYFDKKLSTMKVRIIGIAPVRLYQHPETGQPVRQATFWVYFPELRNALARNEVFSPNNDANRISFDDIFMQRRFDSMILGQSNVYDNRRITEYETGRMALLEAERIKEWLINTEHDVWEY
jgi:gliding motility associated protien GldN